MDLNPTERNLTAGEYVLGTLSAAERNAVEDAAESNTVLRHDIMRWERQLAALALRLKPVSPRPVVWFDLAHRLGLGAAAPAPRVVLWKVWAGLATAAALVLALSLYREMSRPPPKPMTVTERVEVPVAAVSYVALLQMPGSSMTWTVSLTPERKVLSVRASGQPPAAARGKDAQLWWIGELGPVSLGVIPTEGEMLGTLPPGPKYGRGGTIAVSLEPRGGSPEPGPTGPLVSTAQLQQAG